MNMRFEKKAAFKIAGVSGNDGTRNDFNGLWQRLFDQVAVEDLVALGTGESFGVCYDFADMDHFRYMAGFDVSEEAKAQELNLEIMEVPQAEYAVFELVGPIPKSIHKGWQYVMGSFFTQGDYERADTPDFEYYLEGDMYSTNYKMELWVPVLRKEKK